jgi:PilZ domain
MDPNRRHQFRKVPEELAFLQLERDDGGTVLDVSEGGLRFETFAPVLQNGPVHLWFSLNLRDRIEAWGEVVWTNAAKKSGGLRFLRLSEEGRTHIREWMTEFPLPRASGAKAARRWDAVAAFVSKARPRQPTLLARGEDSGDSSLGASIREETMQPPSGLVPVQKYLEAKRKQLMFGMLLGMCISGAIAMAAFKVSNYFRQTRDAEKFARESRAAGPGAEIQPVAPAITTPAAPHPATGDIFSPGKPNRGTPSDTPNSQKAAATLPPRSHPVESPVLVASVGSSTSRQPPSSEDGSQKQRSRTPAQLWASVQAGNSKAAVELAELYIQGEGVPRNCAQARVLLLVASEKRNAGAIKRLEELDKTGCPGE